MTQPKIESITLELNKNVSKLNLVDQSQWVCQSDSWQAAWYPRQFGKL